MLIAIVCLVTSSLGCSTRWREGDDGLTSDEVLESLQKLRADSGAVAGMAEFAQLLEVPTSRVFFAFSDPKKEQIKMGKPWNVMSFLDLSFLGRSDVGSLDLAAALVAFVEDDASGTSTLLVDFAAEGETEYTTKVFISSARAETKDKIYRIQMSDGLILESQDVDNDGALKNVIQLKVYFEGPEGEEYLGKFPTLVGYSN